MDREEILDSVSENVANRNLVKHMLAAEAVMKALAVRLGENEREWGLTGLLHDIDVELTRGDMQSHSRLGADLARELGATETMARAVLVHNQTHGVPLETKLDKALSCTDPLTGLITAAALIRPDKKLDGVTLESIKKRFRESRFAAGVDREQIAACSELLGIELDDFIGIGLRAMQDIAAELGL